MAPLDRVRSAMTPLFRKKNGGQVGARPGTLVVGEEAEPTRVWRVDYDEARLERRALEPGADGSSALADDAATPTGGVRWYDVRGLKDVSFLERLGQCFRVHPLALEDVVNVPQRPKMDLFDEDVPHYLAVFRAVHIDDNDVLEVEQVSVVVRRGVVLSFLESDSPTWKPILQRLSKPRGPLRGAGADYLAYALIDVVVDGYYPVLESLAERLESLETEIMESPTPEVLQRVQRVKRSLLLLRRAVWPQREALARALREGGGVFEPSTAPYLRDTYDHVVQIADVIESYRDLVSELTNTYLSMVSNRMNEIMKVLTIMASIFIPLTFIAGVYGMNFEVMPELRVKWAYPMVLASMLLTAAGMVLFFRRNGWLGSDRRKP